MKKLFALLAIFLILNTPFACNPCGPFDNRPYKIVSMSSTIGSLIENNFEEEVSTNFEIAAIRTAIDETKRIGFNKAVNLWISTSAYACSPPDPIVQIIDELKISSDKTILSGGVEYEPNASLNELFKIIYNSSVYTIDEFIEAQGASPWEFSFTDSSILIQLVDKPDAKIEQQLLLKFTFDDELSYQVLTPVFTVE